MNIQRINLKDLRIFASIWSVIFLVIGVYFERNFFFYISAAFLFVGIVNPTLLNGFYKNWIKLGEFIGGFISKLILLVLFFGLFTPVSAILRILGKDLLLKKVNKSRKSFWIKRERQPESMRKQF